MASLEPADLSDHKDALLNNLLHDRDSVRTAAVKIIARIKPVEPLVPAIVGLLDHTSAQVREAALKALDLLMNQNTLWSNGALVLAVVKALADDSQEVRDFAERALGRVDAKLQASVARAVVDLGLVDHKLSNVRVVALGVLGMLSSDSLSEHKASIIERLEDEDKRVVSTALRALTSLEAKTLESDFTTLLSHADYHVRAEMVAKLPTTDIQATATRILDDSSVTVQHATLKALADFSPSQLSTHASRLVRVLGSSSTEVSKKAQELLRMLLPEMLVDHVGALAAQARHGKWCARAGALSVLEMVDQDHLKAQAAVIINALADSDEDVRAAALQTLSK
eukprot:3539665-Prymnesium_polylepis.1